MSAAAPAPRLAPALVAGGLIVASVELFLHARGVPELVVDVCSSRGVLLAILLVAPARRWPAVLAGYLLLTTAGEAVGGSLTAPGLAVAALQVGQVVLSAALVRRALDVPFRLDSPLTFAVVFGIPLAVGAAGSLATVALLPSTHAGPFLRAWLAEWLSHAADIFVLAPAILSWAFPVRPRRGGRVELALLAAATASLTVLLFVREPMPDPLLRSYPLFPFVLWGAARFGLRGATTLVLFVSGFAWTQTVHGHGPFALVPDLAGRLFEMQTFLGLLGASGALLAVTLDEERRLQEERRRLLEALQEAAQEWSVTFDAIGTAILLVDRAGRIHRANRAAARLAGPERTTLGGGDGAGDGATAPEPWRAAARLVAALAHDSGPVFEELRDGERSWELTATPLPRPGGLIVLTLHDTTRLVTLQEQLHRREKLSALGSVVGGVAHEVRNPLFAISATVDAMQAFGGTAGAAFAPHLDNLRDGVARLGALMTDLLEYGRPSPRAHAPVPLRGVVEGAVSACAPLAHQRSVALRSHVGSDAGSVSGDALRLGLALQNVVENALQHAPFGSRVTIRALPAALGGRPAVDLVVRDEGPGFRPEVLAHAFDPFFTGRRGGTGLGLSIVQRIAEEHGGTAEAGNDPAGGARVVLRLPLAAAPALAAV